MASPSHFFLPVRVLSRVIRGKFLAGLLRRSPEVRSASRPTRSSRRLGAARTDWVVHAKPPFGGPEQVLKYLARYTHRVAISDPLARLHGWRGPRCDPVERTRCSVARGIRRTRDETCDFDAVCGSGFSRCHLVLVQREWDKRCRSLS